MIFTYTQMDKTGTRVMRALGIPVYLVAIGLIVTSPLNTWVNVALVILLPLIYEFSYCKLLYKFHKNIQDIVSLFLWFLSVLTIQVICIAPVLLIVKLYG